MNVTTNLTNILVTTYKKILFPFQNSIIAILLIPLELALREEIGVIVFLFTIGIVIQFTISRYIAKAAGNSYSPSPTDTAPAFDPT